MAIPYSKITEILGVWASNDLPIINFTVNNVLEAIGENDSEYDAVLKYLLRMDGFELIGKKMLLCPDGHKGRTFLLNEPIDEEEIFHCWCEHDYYYDPDSTILVFCFSPDFIYQEKKNSKHKNCVC